MDIFSIKTGDKVKFIGTKMFWFANMIENGDKLEKGAIYTIKSILILSSWTKFTLDETGDLEYNSVWFETI